jgi:tetratricopeptide (TPR) repeat protein
MKIVAILVSCLVTFGCSHNQMRFNLAPGSTQEDYNQARIECGDESRGGGFIFGPLFIVAPVIAVVESVKFAKRHGIQDCLEGKGFRCVANCAHVSQYIDPEKQELFRRKQELERQRTLDAERKQLAAERRKAEAERQQMETLERDQLKPSPPATSETKEVAIGPESSATSIKQFNPKAITWAEKSAKCAASKDWSEMIRLASVAIQIDPTYPEAYVSRSWAYLEKGFPDKALEDCQKALELDTNNTGAFNNRGLYYLRGGDKARAKEDFEKACQGRLEIGCENFKLITGYKPSDKVAYLSNKADTAFNAKNWDEVIRYTSEMPDNATALSVRAGAYAYKGMLDEAIKDSDQAIKINPDYPLAYNKKAFALELKGNRQEAILNYEFACNLKMDLACKNMKALVSKK